MICDVVCNQKQKEAKARPLFVSVWLDDVIQETSRKIELLIARSLLDT